MISHLSFEIALFKGVDTPTVLPLLRGRGQRAEALQRISLCPRNGVLSPVCKVNEQDSSFVQSRRKKKTAVGGQSDAIVV